MSALAALAYWLGSQLDQAVRLHGQKSAEAMTVRRHVLTVVRLAKLAPDERRVFQQQFRWGAPFLAAIQDQSAQDDLWEEGLGDA